MLLRLKKNEEVYIDLLDLSKTQSLVCNYYLTIFAYPATIVLICFMFEIDDCLWY